MSDHDDATMRALYGPNFGKAHQDQYAGAESQRSGEDPGRRTTIEDVNANSGWYRPSRSIFGATLDQELGIKPGSAGLQPLESDYEPVVDDLPEVEAVPAIDADIRAYIESSPSAVLTTATLLTDALHMDEEHIGRGDEMELAAAMNRLGYEKAQRRIDGARVWTWVSRTSIDAVTNPTHEE